MSIITVTFQNLPAGMLELLSQYVIGTTITDEFDFKSEPEVILENDNANLATKLEYDLKPEVKQEQELKPEPEPEPKQEPELEPEPECKPEPKKPKKQRDPEPEPKKPRKSRRTSKKPEEKEYDPLGPDTRKERERKSWDKYYKPHWSDMIWVRYETDPRRMWRCPVTVEEYLDIRKRNKKFKREADAHDKANSRPSRRDHRYKFLRGLDPNKDKLELTEQNLKKIYRRVALIHHPDKGGDVEVFKQIQSSYEYLLEHL